MHQARNELFYDARLPQTKRDGGEVQARSGTAVSSRRKDDQCAHFLQEICILSYMMVYKFPAENEHTEDDVNNERIACRWRHRTVNFAQFSLFARNLANLFASRLPLPPL